MSWRTALAAASVAALLIGDGPTLVAARSGAISGAQARPVPEIAPGFLAGYLQRGQAPDSLQFLPPAPLPQSATQTRDDAAARDVRTLAGSARWRLAAEDADLRFPEAAGAFTCALGVRIGPEVTPRLYLLLRRSLADAGLATWPAKTRWRRPRPFMVLGGPICTPAETEHLRSDGSYPSGHSAVGWAWALILAEAAPERQDAVLARGRAFLQSRVVCNVHWLSDTEAGATVGAAVVARLHAEPAFRADLDAARSEIAATRARGVQPQRDCAAEAAAIASAPQRQP